MVLFLAAALGGAARRYSELADEERQEEKEKAARIEERAYETRKARRDAILDAEKSRIEYERKRDFEVEKQRLIKQRELDVARLKEEGQTGRVREQIESKEAVAGQQVASAERVARLKDTGQTARVREQIESKEAEGQADREVRVDIAALESADREARDKLEAELRREEMENRLQMEQFKIRNAALLKKAEAAKYQYRFLNLGESEEEDAEGLDDFVLEGSYNTEKPGMTTAGNSEQLLSELNQKLADPALFNRVTDKMQSDPEFKRDVLEFVNSATTNYYNRTKSISQNGQVRFNPIFHSPDQPNGVDKKGFANIAKIPGVRERFWRMVSSDSDISRNAMQSGEVTLNNNNSGLSTVEERPVAADNLSLVTDTQIRAKLRANNVRNEDLSAETAGEINALTEDRNMVILALQTGASQNPTNVRKAAEEFRVRQLGSNFLDTEKVLEKAGVLFTFFKSTANQSRPVAPRTQSENMMGMMVTGSATTPDPAFKRISESAKKAIILGRAKYLGAQNLSRTLNKIREIERSGDSSQGAINNVRSFIEGAFGSTGQLRQAASLFASQFNSSGESLLDVDVLRTTSQGYLNFDDAGGVLAGMKEQLLRLAAYQMALTYQSASDKITDADVQRFERMLNKAFISGQQFEGQIANFLEDSNFQLMKNYGFANTTVEDEYANVVAAQKLDVFTTSLGNKSAQSLITAAKLNQDIPVASQPTMEQRFVSNIFKLYKPSGDLKDFERKFLNNVKSIVSGQMITGADARQTEKEVGDNSEITIEASRKIPGQNAFAVRARVKMQDNQVINHFFKLRFEGTGRNFKPFVENIKPEDFAPQQSAMGGVISSFAKSIAARK